MLQSIADIRANAQRWRLVDEALNIVDSSVVGLVLRNPILEVIANFKEGEKLKFDISAVLCINSFTNSRKFPKLIHHACDLILHLSSLLTASPFEQPPSWVLGRYRPGCSGTMAQHRRQRWDVYSKMHNQIGLED